MNENDKATLGLSIHTILAKHATPGREVPFIPFFFYGVGINMGFTCTEEDISNILEKLVLKGFAKNVPNFGYVAVSNQLYNHSVTDDPWDWVKV